MQKITYLMKSNLVMNGYLIMITRAVGSVTGFIFWALAARLILPDNIGLASSVIAASLLIANLSQLGYGYGLVRFLPHADNPSELINLALEIATVFSILLSLLFIFLLNVLSPDLVIIRSNMFLMISFIILSVTTSVGQVVNWVFFARRKFTFSLFYISIQSLLAIVILVTFTFSKNDLQPIIYAYTISSAVGLILSIWLFLNRSELGFKFFLVLPQLSKSPFTTYLMSSFITDQFQRGSNTLLTLLVLNILGPEQNAYFYLTWAIISGMVGLIGGVSSSLFAEGSNHPEKVHTYTITSLKLGLVYSMVACLGVGLFSKIILSFYGAEYVNHAATLFILLLISVIPGIVIYILTAFLRIQGSSRHLLIYAGLDFSIGIFAAFIGMHNFGLIGIGYGWIASRIILVVIGLLSWKSLLIKIERKVILTQSIE